MITINHTHHHYYGTKGIGKKIKRIFSLLNTIKMDQQEAIAKINAYGAQLKKIGTEVTAVKDALAAAIASGETVPQGLADAINGLGSEIQAVDDLNADA